MRRCESEIDFKTADEAGLRGLSDPEVLRLAAGDGRILVTHDRHTMPGHFAEFISKQHSPGVLIISQSLSIARATEELLMIWEASDVEEWVDCLQALPL